MSTERQPDEATKMSGYACDIAVSEIFGIPVERMCGYLIVTVEHLDGNTHRHKIVTGPRDDDVAWEWAADVMEDMAANIREVIR
jgi:hypothetical protein